MTENQARRPDQADLPDSRSTQYNPIVRDYDPHRESAAALSQWSERSDIDVRGTRAGIPLVSPGVDSRMLPSQNTSSDNSDVSDATQSTTCSAGMLEVGQY